MSGYHWSDDPILVKRANCVDELRKDAKELGFMLHYIGSGMRNVIASCGECYALVWMGDDEAYSGDGGAMLAHKQWHNTLNDRSDVV